MRPGCLPRLYGVEMNERSILVRYPTDTSLFSALQLQPCTVLKLGMSNAWRWIESQIGITFPEWVREHQRGLVITGLHIRYLASHTFFDSNTLDVLIHPVRVRSRQRMLQFGFDYLRADKKAFATLSAVGLLLKLHKTDASLSADPSLSPLDARILEKFLPEEIDPSIPPKEVSAMVEALKASNAAPIAVGEHPFRIYRHHCEIADQWSFIDIPGFSGQARELLVTGNRSGRIRDGIRKPLRRWMAEIRRPMALFDDGLILTEVYDSGERLTFVHELRNVTQGHVAALVLEEI
jgi:hypothetical protein